MMNRKIIFLGCTKLSEEILIHLINSGIKITAIFSIPKNFSISYSKEKVTNTNYANLSKYSDQLKIPFYEIHSEVGKRLNDFNKIIEEIQPDVIVAVGWFYMIPKTIREIPKEGVWGIHASLLPDYAGGAPLVWAKINGEKETGVTLFRMNSGVDDGDIIEQEKMSISNDDTIKILLEKASKISQRILTRALLRKKITYVKQDLSKQNIYPQRSPVDGEINLSWDKIRIENFVKAQSKPYPGAWLKIGDKKLIIWDITVEEIKND